MTKFKFNIPDKINVGFQSRKDTYTGKLAYVVYTDKKGVLRKERSWDGWRSHDIDPEEFENVPTDGFVLNKKVGDHRYGWNPRKAWVRIYDPRGFEFEISVNNLIFILEECSSIKGKGIEGEMVYAWDKADLLLLPVSSQEYKDSVNFKEASKVKVTKKDMTEGCIYLHKENEEVMYLGRQETWFFDNGYYEPSTFNSKKTHVFLRLNPEKPSWGEVQPYFFEKGFTKLVGRVGTEPSLAFAEEFDNFKNSKWGSGPAKLVEKKIKEYRTGSEYFFKENGEYKRIREGYTWQQEGGYFSQGRTRIPHWNIAGTLELVPGKSLAVPAFPYTYSHENYCGEYRNMSEIQVEDLFNLELETENKSRIKL